MSKTVKQIVVDVIKQKLFEPIPVVEAEIKNTMLRENISDVKVFYSEELKTFSIFYKRGEGENFHLIEVVATCTSH